MATTNNIVLKGNYNSAVVINKPLSANGETVTLSSVTSVLRDGSVAENSSFSLGEATSATGRNSLATGFGTNASAANSMAQGVSAVTEYEKSYVWSGDDSEVHAAKGVGTFNVYTVGGAAGFYVGGKTLDLIVSESIAAGTAVLSADPQTFTGHNNFAKGVSASGITLGSESTADFSQGNLTVKDRDDGTSNTYAANTKFVTNAVSSAVRSLSSATDSAISSAVTKATSALMTSGDVCGIVEQYLKAALGDSILKG